MTKNELTGQLAVRCQISEGQAERIVNALLEAMTRNLLTGDKLEIRGFGTLSMKVTRPRTSRNPRTQEVVEVGERRGIAYKASSVLLRRLNSEEVTKGGR